MLGCYSPNRQLKSILLLTSHPKLSHDSGHNHRALFLTYTGKFYFTFVLRTRHLNHALLICNLESVGKTHCASIGQRVEGRNEHVIKTFTYYIFNPTRNLPRLPREKIEAPARLDVLPTDTRSWWEGFRQSGWKYWLWNQRGGVSDSCSITCHLPRDFRQHAIPSSPGFMIDKSAMILAWWSCCDIHRAHSTMLDT